MNAHVRERYRAHSLFLDRGVRARLCLDRANIRPWIWKLAARAEGQELV